MNRIPKALIDKEWLEHGNLITWWLALWVIGLFIVPLLTTPMILGIFCALYALWSAQRVGGWDVVHGTEETTFSLPATRREILLARLWITGIPLSIMVIGGIIALAVGLPAFLWSLIVESGFTEWPQKAKPVEWAIATCAPPCVFFLTLAGSAQARSRSSAQAGWLGLISIGFIIGVGSIPDLIFSHTPRGLASCAIMAVVASSSFHLLWRAYPAKEATINPDTPAAVGRWWVTAIVALVVILLILIVLLSTGGSQMKIESKSSSAPAPVKIIKEDK